MALFGLVPDITANAATQAANKSSKLISSGAKDAKKAIKGNYATAAQNLTQIGQQFAPYNATGQSENAMYANGLGVNGQAGYDAALGAFHNGPGYQFALDQANQNVLRNQAATGGLNSGGTLQALSDRAQGLQNQEYQTWLDNLYRGSGQGLQGAQGQASGLKALGDLYQGQGNNLAQISLGKASNLAGIQQQLGQNQQGAQTANAQNTAGLWGNILGLGAKVAGSFF